MNFKLALVAVFFTLFSGVYLLNSQSPASSSQYCGNGGIVQVSASWYCSSVNQAVISNWVKWEPLAILVVFVSFLIAVIIFVFGVALRNDRIRTYAISEMYEAMASAILVAAFLFIAALMFGVLPGIVTGPDINPYDLSINYIAKIQNATSTLTVNLFQTAAVADYLSTLSLQVCEAQGLSCQEATGWFGFIMTFLYFWPAWSILTFFFEAIFSLYVQFYMITFFLYAAIPAFLIPGVLLRAFPPTRHVGGMLMAISIGFYFIMPILFSIAYAFTVNGLSSQLSVANANVQKYTSNGQLFSQTTNPNSPLIGQLTNIQSTFGDFWLAILFFPALIIAMTYTFIIQIAEFIGGMAKSSTRLRALA